MDTKELYQQLQDGVAASLNSDAMKAYLAMQAKFHKYSFGNVMLILHQFPDASQVAGFQTWKKLGRQVKKGEHGIRIFAPCPYKKVVTDDQGNEAEKLINFFRVVTVFDQSQTDGEELPSPVEELGQSEKGDMLWERVQRACPVPLGFEDCKADGYYTPSEQPSKRTITLSNKLIGDARPATLLHEIAHHLAITSGIDKHEKMPGARSQSETIAEGAAFIACAYFGLDTSKNSFGYVANWASDVKAVIKWGEAVQKVGKMLIELVERLEERAA